MKKNTVLTASGKAARLGASAAAFAVLLAFGLILVGCGNKNGDPTSPAGPFKPATLASGATADQAYTKLEAIITYCNAYPGTKNNSVKVSAQTMQSVWSTYSSNWSSYGASVVGSINGFIGNLD